MTYWKLHFIFLHPVEQSNSIIPISYCTTTTRLSFLHFTVSNDSKEECVDYEYYATESKRNPNDNKDRRQLSTEIQNDVCTQMVTMIVIFIPSGVEY